MLAGMSKHGLDAQMIRGIDAYRHAAGAWMMHDAGHNREKFAELLNKPWTYSGVLANVTDRPFAERLLGLGLPIVDVSGLSGHPDIPSVLCDSRASGVIAAEYFIARGFTNFAYVSTSDRRFESERLAGFQQALAEAGFGCWWLCGQRGFVIDADGNDALPSTIKRSAWLAYAPKPLAVFAPTDGLAVNICDDAHARGIPVPEQVAVLGVDNDETVCESCHPPLSSIQMPGEKAGYDAAKLLDALMRGEKPKPAPPAPPIGVFTRQSTDVLAMPDPMVAAAVAYLRDHCREQLAIDEVAAHCRVNRRTLEKHFRKALTRSPLNELFRIRVDLAKRRLIETDASVYVTAVESGFRDAESMATHFKRWVGQTPSQFRKQNRPG